jgi:hypothetical protein
VAELRVVRSNARPGDAAHRATRPASRGDESLCLQFGAKLPLAHLANEGDLADLCFAGP